MKKRIVLFMMAAITSLSLMGCGEAKKIAELKDEFEQAMEDGDYDEAEDLLDEMKDLDDSNEDYKECRKTYKKATNVEDKIILCDLIRTALTTSLMDPALIMNQDNNFAAVDNSDMELGKFLSTVGTQFEDSVLQIVGCTSVDEVYDKMYTKGEIRVTFENGNQITVYLDEGTDITIGSGPRMY